MEIKSIGVIHSPYKEVGDAPRQGHLSEETFEIEIYPDFLPGLKDIENSSHLVILYWGHQSRRDVLQTKTPFGPEVKGVFACRSPNRPNPVALCVVKLLKVEENRLLVSGLDALEGSPLVDIKPYSIQIDSVEENHEA